MCLVLISYQNHPVYKLIVAANRDEFYGRKTARADFWTDYPEILGGRDLEGNGTWMGMTTSGKISMLTNYRDPDNINPSAPSRGRLVSDYLEQGISGLDFIQQIESKILQYNGFNLVMGTIDELWYLSNYRNGVQKLVPGVYGISNHLLDTPWPKVVRGKEKFKSLLRKPEIDPDGLLNLLYDDSRADDSKLPDTGIGLERERALSSMFIKTDNYGSRCSTVVLVDQDNHVLFVERTYDLKTFEYADRTFEFDAGVSRQGAPRSVRRR